MKTDTELKRRVRHTAVRCAGTPSFCGCGSQLRGQALEHMIQPTSIEA